MIRRRLWFKINIITILRHWKRTYVANCEATKTHSKKNSIKRQNNSEHVRQSQEYAIQKVTTTIHRQSNVSPSSSSHHQNTLPALALSLKVQNLHIHS